MISWLYVSVCVCERVYPACLVLRHLSQMQLTLKSTFLPQQEYPRKDDRRETIQERQYRRHLAQQQPENRLDHKLEKWLVRCVRGLLRKVFLGGCALYQKRQERVRAGPVVHLAVSGYLCYGLPSANVSTHSLFSLHVRRNE